MAEHSFDDVRHASPATFEAMAKAKAFIVDRVDKDFEEQHKSAPQEVHMRALEDLKQESNKKFFEQMSQMKQGKHGQPAKGRPDDLGFLDLVDPPQPPKKRNDDFDIFDLGEGLSGLRVGADAQAKPARSADVGNSDLLDLDMLSRNNNPPSTPNSSIQTHQTASNSDLFALDMTGLSESKLQTVSASLTTPSQIDAKHLTGVPSNTSADLFLEEGNKQSKQSKKEESDPFNFLVF